MELFSPGNGVELLALESNCTQLVLSAVNAFTTLETQIDQESVSEDGYERLSIRRRDQFQVKLISQSFISSCKIDMKGMRILKAWPM